MAISSLPSLDRTSASFRTNCNTFFATSLPQFVTEANAMAAAITALSAGTAMAIPYTFDSTTTDADPGAGKLRLSNATQNLATTMRLDLTGADGSDWTSVIDTFDDSTSTLKGHIMLQKLADASKWMLFAVTALASPSGYKNLTVSCVASSAASPFANGDSLVLKFTAKGDKGDTGPAASVGLSGPLAVLTPSAAANVDALSVFSSTYDNYLIIGEGLLPAANDSLKMRFANSGAVDSTSVYCGNRGAESEASISTFGSAFEISLGVLASGKGCNFVIHVTNANDATRIKSISGKVAYQDSATPSYIMAGTIGAYHKASAISGIRLFWSGGNNFSAVGKIFIYGYNNT